MNTSPKPTCLACGSTNKVTEATVGAFTDDGPYLEEDIALCAACHVIHQKICNDFCGSYPTVRVFIDKYLVPEIRKERKATK